MTRFEAMSPSALKARELELDRRLLNRPEVAAQRVERQLIKRLQISAPWLIPLIIDKQYNQGIK